jgi:hypothetical protein
MRLSMCVWEQSEQTHRSMEGEGGRTKAVAVAVAQEQER